MKMDTGLGTAEDASRSLYKTIFKATTIFGGVQIFQIFTGLLKGKATAFFLGPAGMGVHSLYLSSTSFLVTLFGLGLMVSAVRFISNASLDSTGVALSKSVVIFKRLIYICAFLGLVFIICASRYISYVTFEDESHGPGFMGLSLFLAFTLMAQANTAILQGLGKLRQLALSSLISSIIGLAALFPLYSLLGTSGIVPVIVSGSLVQLIVTFFFVKKLPISKVKLTINESVKPALEMIKLGVALVFAQLIGQLSVFFINRFISAIGGSEDVGFYQAALGITQQSISLVFAAMASDYFPRLAKVSNDRELMSETVNKQGEIIMIIIMPVLSAMMIFTPLIIKVLLTESFSESALMMRLLVFSLFFKAISYSMGYVSFAKNDKLVFLLLEGVLSNIIYTFSVCLGYRYNGLTGIGIGVTAAFVFYFLIIFIVGKKRYKVTLSKSFIRLASISFLLVSASLVLSLYSVTVLSSIVGIFIVLFSVILSFKFLSDRLDVLGIIRRRIKRS